jgi:hypothetical protein
VKLKLIFLCFVLNFFFAPLQANVTIPQVLYDGASFNAANPVDPTPLIKVDTSGSNVPSFNSFRVTIDGVLRAETYNFVAPYFNMQITTPLSVGTHTVILGFKDANNTGSTTNVVTVLGTTQAVQGPLYAYPSPATTMINFQYQLALTDTVQLHVFNLAGNLVYEQEFAAGSLGAVAGLNNVSWNLVSGYNSGTIPNGAYIAILTPRGGNQVLKKAKFLVYR